MLLKVVEINAKYIQAFLWTDGSHFTHLHEFSIYGEWAEQPEPGRCLAHVASQILVFHYAVLPS
jgi:hypothetical protein